MASPQDVLLAVITAVPRAIAVKEVCSGTQPAPGIVPQLLGGARSVVSPSCRNTAGEVLGSTFQAGLLDGTAPRAVPHRTRLTEPGGLHGPGR